MKLGEPILKERHLPAGRNHFLWFSCQKKQSFCIVKKYFLTNTSFRVVKTDFLASTNYFSYFFRDSCGGKPFFKSSGNVFLNEPFIPAIRKGFFSLMETVTLLESFFLLVETVISGNQFLKTELILTGGNGFSG